MFANRLLWAFGFSVSLCTSSQASELCPIDWQDLGPTPDYAIRAKPQGLAFYDDGNTKGLIFSNHYEKSATNPGHGSKIYLIPTNSFPLNDEKIGNLARFSLPPELPHVSGLAVMDQDLYAVDYKGGWFFKIDLREAFQHATNFSLHKLPLNRGPSGLAQVCHAQSGRNFLAVSEFDAFKSCETVLYAFGDQICESDFDQPHCRYTNEGYSQGLEFVEIDHTIYLAESLNRGWAEGLGLADYSPRNPIRPTIDEVRFYRLEDLLLGKSKAEALESVLKGPGPMIEDLAWDGTYLYTTDELRYRFYRGSVRSGC